MTGENQQPVAITVLAWLHIIFGSLIQLAVLISFGRRLVAGEFGEGIPLLWFGILAAPVLLGVMLGVGLARGRKWARYVTSSFYAVLAIGATLFFLGPGDTVQSERGNVTRIQSLGESGIINDDAFLFLLESLEMGTTGERISAAWALRKARRPEAVPALLEAAREDEDTNVRINAIGTLSAIHGESMETLLIEFLDDDDAQVRAAALRGLYDNPSADAAPKIARLLRDEDVMTRRSAADVLGNMGSPDALPMLQQAATDEDPDVRSRIAFALGKIRDTTAVPTLEGLLEDASWEVRANAVQALGMIGGREARAAVVRMHDDPHSIVRDAAEGALEKM